MDLNYSRVFTEIAEKLCSSRNVFHDEMYGKPCLTVNNNPFVLFFDDHLVFKLSDEYRSMALDLPGSKLWDPSGKDRPMQEWIQVSANYISACHFLAWAAKEMAEMHHLKSSY